MLVTLSLKGVSDVPLPAENVPHGENLPLKNGLALQGEVSSPLMASLRLQLESTSESKEGGRVMQTRG